MAGTPRVRHLKDVCWCAVSGMLWGESGWVLAGAVRAVPFCFFGRFTLLRLSCSNFDCRGEKTVQRQSFKDGLICGIMAEGVGLGAEARRGQGQSWHGNCLWQPGWAAGSSTGSTWCQDVRAHSEPYLWIPASQLHGLEQVFASLHLLLSLGCSLSPCGKNSP